ncbi:ribosome hibernation-promoting factor, HPF/YfiA family [Terrisporobacter sp.]|uniref:ribosome hibernation-promoting factor, HPF/YfiA family n=1 Tax=Terrisporobacter sp. TaxID=1965305 RepID=UPI00262F7AC1|nr:ribosome-associated translation inhibitor RaiA [Terrisporobacter sp.]
MKIIISGKKLELTDGIKVAIEEKIGRLDRYLNPETEVKVTVSAKKSTQKIEVTIIPISGPIIRAEDSEENLYAAIDVVYDKLKKQIRRYKNKLQDKHQSKDQSIRFQSDEVMENDEVAEDVDDNLDIVIERRKKFDMKPMSPEEAILQMELIEHGFYMFRNIDSDEISIVYRRENGGYGLIEHE